MPGPIGKWTVSSPNEQAAAQVESHQQAEWEETQAQPFPPQSRLAGVIGKLSVCRV